MRGWKIRDRSDAAPGIRRFVEQVTMFLTLVGLMALGVGGVGAGQAISAFLDRKRVDIAILKSLGADGSVVFLIFFLQVMAIAVLAAVARAWRWAPLLPFAIAGSMASACRCRPLRALSRAAAAGGGLRPAVGGRLCRAAAGARPRRSPPASLFRDSVAPADARGALPYRARRGGALRLVVGARPCCWRPRRSSRRSFWRARSAAAGAAAPDGGRLAPRICDACRVRARRCCGWRFANLARPGAATGGVVTALGLGLTLLATVTLLNAHHRGAGGRRAARPRAQLLLCRHPAGRGGALRPHHHRLFQRAATTSARR